jgi:hypothetical protein
MHLCSEERRAFGRAFLLRSSAYHRGRHPWRTARSNARNSPRTRSPVSSTSSAVIFSPVMPAAMLVTQEIANTSNPRRRAARLNDQGTRSSLAGNGADWLWRLVGRQIVNRTIGTGVDAVSERISRKSVDERTLLFLWT